MKQILSAEKLSTQDSSPPENRNFEIWRWPAVKKITGLSRTTVWRLYKTGKFPKPVRIGNQAVGWLACDVVAWQKSLQHVG